MTNGASSQWPDTLPRLYREFGLFIVKAHENAQRQSHFLVTV
jgi:hypothetical protein